MPKWISRDALLRLHAQSLATFGGLPGLRDEGLLDSALHRPINQHDYEACEDMCRLAAAYAFGIAKNHPFTDGNKRGALLACGVFLSINGIKLVASQPDTYSAVIKLASGEWDEPALAEWLRSNTRP